MVPSSRVQAKLQYERQLVARRMSLIAPSGIRKFFDLIASMDGVISLGVGEPDFVTPWSIREAAVHSLETGHTMYTSNLGMPELRRELAHHLRDNCGVEYDPDRELIITVGVSEALDLAARAILDPGDEVLFPDPSYVAYPSCLLLAGATPRPVRTDCAGEFKLDAAAVAAGVTARTKAILLGFPANPTGAVMTRDELQPIADVARENDLAVISDEIYRQLVYGVEPTCFAALPGMKERTIVLGGFSKAYAMTGWRVGYAAASAEIIEAMNRIHQYTMLCAPIMGQVAAIEALRSGEESLKQMLEEYDRRRRVIVSGLNRIGLTCFEPKGAFYVFPSITPTRLTSEEFADRLLREEKVAVVPGSVFGQCGEGYVRCCYAAALPDIEEALRRIQRFVERQR